MRAGGRGGGTNPRGKKSTIVNNRGQRILAIGEFL